MGRLLLPLARASNKAIGVDVSGAMRKLARAHAAEEGLAKVELVRADDSLSGLSGGYNLLTSVIVFQHIPPDRGYNLLAKLLEKLNRGGYFYLHFTFAKDRRFLANATQHVEVYRSEKDSVLVLQESAPEGTAMSMYDYDLNRLFLLLMKNHVDNMLTRFIDHGGCYGIMICGSKA